MIAKGLLLQGVLKSSRSWRTRGCFMIAKTFAPFSGVKPFVIMRERPTVHDRGTCEGMAMSEQPEFFTYTGDEFLG
jgi:hypothetical protein